jgi:putative SOS response-associated peptidase YedK
MCYNIAYLEARAEKYANRYKDIPQITWQQRLEFEKGLPVYYFVSGFVHPRLPVLTTTGLHLYEWGLIPAWVKDEATAKDLRTKTLNAVGETVFEKPSFRSSIAKKRCLVSVSGFYEWRDYKKKKYPYFVKVKDEDIFSLGGIYENWVDKNTGEVHDTFSILTTAANPLMEKIHNLKKRMPLILTREQEKQWLDPSLSPEEIKKLITPFDERLMEAYSVSQQANSPRNNRNVPEIMNKVEYAELESE